ncbi:MAG TPA: D-glycerate dehydrogenase, partial [Acidimicrobiales bacterium]|nr:D-glycerate dehydrogenase [Acidimicrobiales bacterium]
MTTTRPCVAVSGALPERGVVRLGEVADVALWKGDAAPSPAEAAALAAQAEALVAIGVRVDAALLDACPRLRVVTNVAVGYDNLDVAELTRRRIPAGNTPGVLTAATAELAFTLILAASRRVREGMEVVRQRTWPSRMSFDFLLGGELAGARLGVVGAG